MLILISWPFNNRAYTRLGIDTLEANKVEFKILNLFELLYPESKECSFDRIVHENEITIQSLWELKNYFKKDEIILNYLNIKRKTLKVFLLLSAFRVNYISISNMPIPSKKNQKLKILNFFLHESKYGAVVQRKEEYPFSRRTKFIYIHSIDYDTMIRFERKSQDRIVKENYIVFLDQNLPFHLDFKRNNTKPYVTAEKYYTSLNNYFDYLEKKLNKKVVIASHPNSDGKKYFNKICIKDNTINLIKYSDSVLIHCSTALSFAIIYNKPISMIVTDEIVSSKMQIFNKFLSKELAIPMINIDKSREINFVESNENFLQYKSKYITQSSYIDLLSMEILLNNLKYREEK